MYVCRCKVKILSCKNKIIRIKLIYEKELRSQLRDVTWKLMVLCIQGVTGGTDQTSGECSLGHTIPI